MKVKIFKAKAYSKVNISLKVFRLLKNDNLHKIDGIFLLYKKMYDVITIQKNLILSINFVSNSLDLSKIDKNDNTVINAIKLVENFIKRPINLKIKIIKNIPIGSGLGGGSSDGALILNYLCKKYKINKTTKQILGLKLGSDVNFFLTKYKIARVSNYGEVVKKCKTLWQIKKLILNNYFVSTSLIYKEYDKLYDSLDHSKTIDDVLKYKISPFNDLQLPLLKTNKNLYFSLITIKIKWKKTIINGSGSSFVMLK